MSQESQHGRWSISDSEEEDIIPPTPQKTSITPSIKPDVESRPNKISTSVPQEQRPNQKDEERTLNAQEPSAPSIGSEARRAAHTNQTDPVKYESQASPAVKRKRETEEGGWNLSDSDDEEDPPAGKVEPQKVIASPKRKKAEDARTPSPHGTGYYKEEPADFFDTGLALNDMYRFYLNKVTGIPKKFNTGALHIKEILSPMFGTLKESVQFNYCFDIPWMVEQYPPEFRDKPVIIVHGDKREAKARLIEQAKPYPHIRFCQAKLDIAFGTHHTKMMLLWYQEGFRVIILTSNLIRADWYQKTQG